MIIKSKRETYGRNLLILNANKLAGINTEKDGSYFDCFSLQIMIKKPFLLIKSSIKLKKCEKILTFQKPSPKDLKDMMEAP